MVVNGEKIVLGVWWVRGGERMLVKGGEKKVGAIKMMMCVEEKV